MFTYNSGGQTWYLYRTGRRYFFSKNPQHPKGTPLDSLPEVFEVVVSPRSGMPMIKSKNTDEQLPPDFQRLIETGWRPSKKNDNWYLETSEEGRTRDKYVPRRYSKIMETIAATMPEKKRPQKSDDEWAAEIRGMDERIAKRKPFIQKELEHTAWFGNLILDVGHLAYQKLQRFVDWTDDDITSEYMAKEKISKLLDALIQLYHDPELILKIQMENAMLKTQLDIARQGWMLERVLKNTALERGNLLLKHMDRESLESAAKEFIGAGLLELTPEMIQKLSEEQEA